MQNKYLALIISLFSATLAANVSNESLMPPENTKTSIPSISPDRQSQLNDELIDAIVQETCTLEAIQEIVEAGADTTTVDYEFGGTALMWAAYHNNVEVVEYLVAQGSDVNAHNDAGETALIWLASQPHESEEMFAANRIAEYLINAEADATMRDAAGNTALMEAAYNNNAGIVLYILRKHQTLVNDVDNDGNSSLHHAASQNAAASMRQLVAYKAKLTQKNNNRETALHVAAMNGNVEAVEFLVKNYHALKISEELNNLDVNDFSALHWAAVNGHTPVVVVLANAKVALNTLDKDGHTPLEDAASKGRVAVVEVLLRKGAGANIHGSRGITPLHRSAKNGHVRTSQTLLNNGAEVDITDSEGRTPLHYVVRAERSKLIDVLIEAGADPFKQDNHGQSPWDNASEDIRQFINQALSKYKTQAPAAEENVFEPMQQTDQNNESSSIKRYWPLYLAGSGILAGVAFYAYTHKKLPSRRLL